MMIETKEGGEKQCRIEMEQGRMAKGRKQGVG